MTPTRNRLVAVGLVVVLAIGLIGFFQRSEAATTTMTKTVAASADDARSAESGAFTTTERSALVGAGNGVRANVNGFRFTGVTIPPGSIITGVSFSMIKGKTGWSRVVFDCAFEASDNAAGFSATSTPGQRTLTAARAHVDNNVKRTAGRRYTLCDGAQLVTSLQQVIDRPGWRAGNSFAFMLWGPATPAWARTDFLTSDAGAQTAPQLTISYTSSSVVPTNTPTNTPTATATSTPVNTPTNTPTSTSGTTTPPTTYAANVPWSTRPSWTQPAGAATPVAGQPCPVWVHDRYAVQGQDGLWYPTWHPPVDPQYGCVFGHEHGDDPSTSVANSTPPAFGYAAIQAGMTEPHVGFKVAVLNAGVVADDGRVLTASYRIVLHMGTSAVGRYTQPMHSIQYDYVSSDGGRWFHLYGIGDTGNGTGSTCTNPRDGGRDFSTTDCADTYEIWNSVNFRIIDPARPFTDPFHVIVYASFSMAVFDPITTQDPANVATVIYTQMVKGNPAIDPASPQAEFRGCDRETYGGPNYWDNARGATTYYTDAYGNLVSGPGPGIIAQQVSLSSSTTNEVFKVRSNTCDATTHAPN